jgi:ABC-type amino acid transport system permease subunit
MPEARRSLSSRVKSSISRIDMCGLLLRWNVRLNRERPGAFLPFADAAVFAGGGFAPAVATVLAAGLAAGAPPASVIRTGTQSVRASAASAARRSAASSDPSIFRPSRLRAL